MTNLNKLIGRILLWQSCLKICWSWLPLNTGHGENRQAAGAN